MVLIITTHAPDGVNVYAEVNSSVASSLPTLVAGYGIVVAHIVMSATAQITW